MLQLSGFDLASWIQQLNQTEAMAYLPGETFGYSYFDERQLESTKARLASISHGIDQDFFTTAEKDFLKAQQHSFKATQSYFRGELAVKPTLIRDKTLSQRLQNKSEYILWLREQKQCLDNAAIWEADFLFADLRGKLKKQWKARTQFICHTHAALIEASENITNLIQYHQEAAKKLHHVDNRLRIPIVVYQAYSAYLAEFIKTAQQLEQKIAYEMQQRLSNWDRHQSTVGFIALLLRKLKPRSDLKQSTPVFIDKLTPQCITGFHQYIIKKADAKTKIELRRCSWFHETENVFPTKLYNFKSHPSLVPANLAKYIPSSAPKLPWLFKGAQFRHEFFKNKLGVLAMFKRSHQPEQCIVDITNPQQWQTLLSDIREQEAMANEAIEELTQKKHGKFSRLFQNRTRQFLREWDTLLINHRSLQIENKVTLAEQLSIILKEKNKGNLMYTAVFSWQTCAALKILLEEIQSNLVSYALKNTELERKLRTLQTQIAELLHYNQLFQALQRLANGESLPEKAWRACEKQLDFLKREHLEAYQSFLNLCLLQRSVIYSQFKETVKVFFTTENSMEQTSYIYRLFLLVIQHGADKDKADLAIRIKKMFLSYMNILLKTLKEGKEIDAGNLATMNSLLQMLCETTRHIQGKQITHAGLALKDHLISFANPCFTKAVLVCKVRVLAASLAEEFLIARVSKDSKQLDAAIKDYILTHPSLGYTVTHVDEILTRLRDRAVKENKTIEVLSDELREDEKVIVGFNNPETAVITALLNASIFGKQASAVMQNAEIPFAQRVQYLENFNSKLHCLFTNADQPLPFKRLLTAKSGRRLLFNAADVDTSLLELRSTAAYEEDDDYQLNLTKLTKRG